MLSGFLLGVYFFSMLGFSFVYSPIMCCLLLVCSAISSSCFVYVCVGFSWYLVLFCLVYVGGVYILFVYVSLYNPNSFVGLGLGCVSLLVFFFFFFFFCCSLVDFSCFEDNSHYVCSFGDGFGYCLFCLVLMLGFSFISFISGGKDSFFR